MTVQYHVTHENSLDSCYLYLLLPIPVLGAREVLLTKHPCSSERLRRSNPEKDSGCTSATFPYFVSGSGISLVLSEGQNSVNCM